MEQKKHYQYKTSGTNIVHFTMNFIHDNTLERICECIGL